MPQPNDYSVDLKHRLVGAAVLIVAAVIVLTIALTGQKQGRHHTLIDNGDVAVQIQQVFISRIEVDSPDASGEQIAIEPVKNNFDSKQESFTGLKDKTIEEDLPATNLVGLASGWVVRVGVFQIPENAKKRQSLLDDNGFNVNLEETKLDGRTAFMVFLGPFSSEDEAERMKVQAVMVTNDKAFVARYP